MNIVGSNSGAFQSATPLQPCDYCGNREFKLLYTGRDYLEYSPLTFNVVRCSVCGTVCLNPRPENMLPYYDYYRRSSVPEKDYFLFLRPDRVKMIRRWKPGGRVLDIGCGTGGFLLEMAAAGWEVHGCDIYPGVCEQARNAGLPNIYNGEVLALPLPEKHFDLITLWHVLEHLEKPATALIKIAALLKDDGLLIIECPDFSSIQAKVFKDKWFALDLPRHLYQLEPGTLGKMLASAGLSAAGRDRKVNSRIAFISLKTSVLRLFGVQKAPTVDDSKGEAGVVTGFRSSRHLWGLLRYATNIAFLLASQVLVLTGNDDSFRIYCRKTGGAGARN